MKRSWAIVAIAFCIISWIVQGYRAIRWRVRLYWRIAYGVPWEWIARREWQNKDLFYGGKPWHCILCGKAWLPFEDWIPVFGEIRQRPEGNKGPGRPYNDAVSWPCEWGREIGWYVQSLGLWLPTGWLNGHVRYLCRRVHPRRYHRWGFPIMAKVQDCFTGQTIVLPTGPMVLNTLAYVKHWIWVHVRAVLVFALLVFRVVWAWLWSYCPIRAFRIVAYVLDDPATRATRPNYWPFAVPPLLGRPARWMVHVDAVLAWRVFSRTCRRLVKPKQWFSRGTRAQWRFFWRQWPRTWRNIPPPWRRLQSYFARSVGPFRYLLLVWRSCKILGDCYFVADGIELDAYAPDTYYQEPSGDTSS